MENDYISRSELLKTLRKEEIPFNADINYFIMNAPAADVAPVVRCKDCIYFIQGKIHGSCDIHCNGVGEEEVVKKNFFCAYGERTA